MATSSTAGHDPLKVHAIQSFNADDLDGLPEGSDPVPRLELSRSLTRYEAEVLDEMLDVIILDPRKIAYDVPLRDISRDSQMLNRMLAAVQAEGAVRQDDAERRLNTYNVFVSRTNAMLRAE